MKGEKSRLWTLSCTFKLTLSFLAEPKQARHATSINISKWRMGVPNELQNAKRNINTISQCSIEIIEDERDIKKAK